MIYGAADLERIFGEQLSAVAQALSALGAEYMLIGGRSDHGGGAHASGAVYLTRRH